MINLINIHGTGIPSSADLPCWSFRSGWYHCNTCFAIFTPPRPCKIDEIQKISQPLVKAESDPSPSNLTQTWFKVSSCRVIDDDTWPGQSTNGRASGGGPCIETRRRNPQWSFDGDSDIGFKFQVSVHLGHLSWFLMALPLLAVQALMEWKWSVPLNLLTIIDLC